jgi:hypothetical protein
MTDIKLHCLLSLRTQIATTGEVTSWNVEF